VIQYLPHVQGRKEAFGPPKDDIAHLFLDDKSVDTRPEGEDRKERSNGMGKDKGAVKDQGADLNLQDGEDDDIQIIEPPSTGDRTKGTSGPAATNGVSPEETDPGRTDATIITRKRKRQYHTLAVKPAGAVIPMLQNLLSPLVMGVTKSARQVSPLILDHLSPLLIYCSRLSWLTSLQAASTTAQQAAPTPLSGIITSLQSFSFPALSSPQPPISLTFHSPPSQHSNTIFLEAEYADSSSESGALDVIETILKEFLLGCIPDHAGGERRWWIWDEGEGSKDGWEGSERTRRATQLLGRCLRENGII
jgi:hypothetical protein